MSLTRALSRTPLLVVLATMARGPGAWAEEARAAARFVSVSGERFVDPEGRHLLLHGLNIVDKSADWSHNHWLNESGYAAMKEWGFNCVRLGFTWASVEPEPGRYSDTCLAEIEKRVAWAARNGLYVFLDMHQDLFSMKYSDGAPEWATLTDGKPHVAPGAVWSDAYFTSLAVQAAFDNFYANKPGPDGVGLQDHYTRAWRHVAERFAKNPTVIGYDLMNEPFAGSLVPLGMLLVMRKLAEEIRDPATTGPADTEAVVSQWSSPEGRSGILKKLSDARIYARVLDSAGPVFGQFERTKLTAMFQRVTNAIRQVDRNHIIFLETSVSANMGVYSGIEPMKDADGRRDPLQAYAPHGYDLVTDTPGAADPSNERVRLIFARHGETAKRLQMPMLVGEWGAYYGNPRALPAAQFVCRLFEGLLCSDTYWSYEKNIERTLGPALIRPYPMCVAGHIGKYTADPARPRFECVWTEGADSKGTSRFFVPETYRPTKERIRITPEGRGCTVEPVRDGSRNLYVLVPALGEPHERRLVIE
jgi:endoglycosylceramidase